MVLCSLHLHIYVGKDGSGDQESELWNVTSINQSSNKNFSQINQFHSSVHSKIKQDKPYYLASCNFMKRKCNQLVVRKKIESPSLLHIRFNYALVSKVLYQLGVMMHSSNPAFSKRRQEDHEFEASFLCHKARSNYSNNKTKYTSSIQPLLLCQSGLVTRTEIIHCDYNCERIKLSFQMPCSQSYCTCLKAAGL